MSIHSLLQIQKALNTNLKKHPLFIDGMNFDSVEYKEDLKFYVPRVKNMGSDVYNPAAIKAIYEEVTQITFQQLGI